MILALFVPNFCLRYVYFVAAGIGILYQIVLSLGLGDYLLDRTRQTNFFTQNAVGMCQTFGQLVCYLVGVGFGRKLYSIDYTKKGYDWLILYEHLKLMGGALVFFLFGYFVFQQTAPRLCNLAYVSYVCMFTIYCCLVAFIFDRITVNINPNGLYDGPSKTSRLIYFMMGNILTGVSNILCGMELEKKPVWVQMVVITTYAFVLHAMFVFFVVKKVPLRFW